MSVTYMGDDFIITHKGKKYWLSKLMQLLDLLREETGKELEVKDGGDMVR